MGVKLRPIYGLFVILVSFNLIGQGRSRPDFGVPAMVLDSGFVGMSANLLRDSMNEVVFAIKRIPLNFELDMLRKAASSIQKLATGVAQKGRNLANIFYKASSERTVPMKNVFTKLYLTFGEMGLMLTEDGPFFVKQLNELMGNITANEFDKALENMNSSLVETLKAVNNLEHALNKSLQDSPSSRAVLKVPRAWSKELSSSLLKFKDQTKSLTRAVDASVKSIMASNFKLVIVNSHIRIVELGIQSSLFMFYSAVHFEYMLAENKYKLAQKNIESVLTGASQRLRIISSNEVLNALSDRLTDEFSEQLSELRGRSESDLLIYSNTFHWIRSETANDVKEARRLAFNAVNSTAVAMVSVILERERFAEQCNARFAFKVPNALAEFQIKASSCLSRERGSLSIISGAVGQVLLSIQTNTADFSNDVDSCSKFVAFGSNDEDHIRAKDCLEARLREMHKHSQWSQGQFESLGKILQAEAKSSLLRTKQCLMNSVRQINALLNDVKVEVRKCATSGL